MSHVKSDLLIEINNSNQNRSWDVGPIGIINFELLYYQTPVFWLINGSEYEIYCKIISIWQWHKLL